MKRESLEDRLRSLREEAILRIEEALRELGSSPSAGVEHLGLGYSEELEFGIEWIDNREPNLVFLRGQTVFGDVCLDCLPAEALVALADALGRFGRTKNQEVRR